GRSQRGHLAVAQPVMADADGTQRNIERALGTIRRQRRTSAELQFPVQIEERRVNFDVSLQPQGLSGDEPSSRARFAERRKMLRSIVRETRLGLLAFHG